MTTGGGEARMAALMASSNARLRRIQRDAVLATIEAELRERGFCDEVAQREARAVWVEFWDRSAQREATDDGAS